MPASDEWQTVQDLEGLMAILAGIADHQRVMLAQAWQSGSFDQIYVEAVAQGHAIERLRDEMSKRWAKITDLLQRENGDVLDQARGFVETLEERP